MAYGYLIYWNRALMENSAYNIYYLFYHIKKK